MREGASIKKEIGRKDKNVARPRVQIRSSSGVRGQEEEVRGRRDRQGAVAIQRRAGREGRGDERKIPVQEWRAAQCSMDGAGGREREREREKPGPEL
jgi:hypothetical protein